MTHPRPWVLAATTLALFLNWSNSFTAISYLLGTDGGTARLDWVSLTVARFGTAALPCAACPGSIPASGRIRRQADRHSLSTISRHCSAITGISLAVAFL